MKFEFYTDQLADCGVGLMALGVFETKVGDSWAFEALDRALAGLLAEIVADENFRGRTGQRLLVHTHGRIQPKRVLLIGLGKREEFDVPDTRRYGAVLVDAARDTAVESAAAALPPIDPLTTDRCAQFLTEGIRLAAYRYDRHVSEENPSPLRLQNVRIAPDPQYRGNPPHLSVARAEVVARAVCMARDMTNEPSGDLTPTKLAEVAASVAKDNDLECKVLGPKECERQKMRLLLAVGQGSSEEPRFIHMIYRPKGKEQVRRRIVLVGKGVTFDSGGLSLKPSKSMVDMKCDMAGAAVVIATLGALPTLGLHCEVHGIVAAAENMVSGSAYKLGDIITGLGGKSVEIVNTDAEGRLTLADALAYSVKLKPDEIIDLATLTGACMVALGPHAAGVMGNDVTLVEHLLAAARRVGEEVWHLPLLKRLHEQLESPVADLKNAGERWGGALTAGLFLKEFVSDIPWVHVDIAGPAYAEKAWSFIPQGGTGFGVATLLEYLLSRDSSGAG